MTMQERDALVRGYLGQTVTVLIDRPIGYVHQKPTYSLVYPINYGYIPGVLGGDGEELDVYVLGINEPVEQATVQIIGIVFRDNDVEDKLIAAPDGMVFSADEIANHIHFQEQYFDSEIEMVE